MFEFVKELHILIFEDGHETQNGDRKANIFHGPAAIWLRCSKSKTVNSSEYWDTNLFTAAMD